MPPESDSPLDSLQHRLYQPQAVDGIHAQAARSAAPTAPEHWEAPAPPPADPKKRMSWTSLLLIISAGFFVVAGIATAAILFFGFRGVSSDNVTITAEGPITAAGGEDVPINITIHNGNPAPMQGTVLSLHFPDGTTDPTDTSHALANIDDQVGDVPAGGTVRRTVHASFFGTENQKVSIPISLSYKTQDSNATFEKKAQYAFTISTSPVGLTVTTLSEVASGQPITLSVLVRSNATKALGNVAVRATYPTGFQTTSVTPQATDGNLFVLGTLQPGEEREVRVTGTLTGIEGEQRVFHFEAGSLGSDARTFGVSYLIKDAPITLAKPFFSTTLSLNHSDGDIVVRAGEQVVGLLTWSNGLASAIRNGTVTVALSGDALASRVDVTNGFYRSSDHSVLYSKDTAGGLANLNPGDTGNGSFSFTTKTGSALATLRNPFITVAVSVAGTRSGTGNVPESVSNTIVRTVKVATELSLSTKLVHTTGPYKNDGPWPPTADKETMYTVQLSVKNSVNSVAGAKATMTLPSYVRFTGQASPGISYDEASRTVTWNAGDIAAGAAGDGAFQIGFTPSSSQKGTSPVLVSDATIVGVDRFVQGQVSGSAPLLTSDAKQDPAYTLGTGTVQ